MKIVFVDNSIDGHHLSYLSALIEANPGESVFITPQRVEGLGCRQHVYSVKESKKRTIRTYLLWLRQVLSFVQQEKPDIVHFLYGDVFYRFFGIGLSMFKKYRRVVTFHWAKDSLPGKISTRMICRSIDNAVVHSAYFQEMFRRFGIFNVTHIEYPQFHGGLVSKEKACAFWDISPEIPTIACVGHTREDKGLDILLDALKLVKTPFQLLIAGKEDAFTREFIEDKARAYLSQVRLCLRYLSEEEIELAFGASDIIALPYRRVFNGASGPLGEGVWLGKCIVGANHGNLGDTISRNHLGYTFETENVESLACALEKALSGKFRADAVYSAYKEKLRVSCFQESYRNLYMTVVKE